MFRAIGNKTLGLAFMSILAMLGMVMVGKVPLLGGLLLSVAGIPAFLGLLAWGIQWFLIYGIVSMTVIAISSESSLAIGLAPLVMFPALLLSTFVKQGLKPLEACFKTIVLASLFSLGLLWASNQMLATNDSEKFEPFKQHLAEQVQIIETQLDKIETGGKEKAENIELARKNIKVWFTYMLLLAPATFIFTWHLVSVCIFYIGAVKFAHYLGFSLNPFPPFSTWKFDWKLIWFFIAGWVLFNTIAPAIASSSSQSIFLKIGANCLAISNLLYFISGMSLLFFMFKKYKIGLFAKIGLSCFALILTQAVVWFGIIDVWVDFRTPKAADVTSQ